MVFLFVNQSDAVCKDSFLNPLADISYQAMFPLRIGSITVIKSDIDTPPDTVNSPMCICGIKAGITGSFWELARMAETVKDPYCFPSIGAQLGGSDNGFLAGDNGGHDAGSGDSTVVQTHWFIFPVFAVVGLFLDSRCLENAGFDLAYLTEVDPTHQNCLLAFLLNPEALLFGNPAAQIACVADAIASNVYTPIDALFWCAGSHGSIYPLCGTDSNSNYVQSQMLMVERQIFKMGREGLLWDPGIDVCDPIPSPIWVKSHYRFQLSKPVRDKSAQLTGRSSLIWGALKNPPFNAGGNASDNFLWMLFRKKLCCESLY